MTALASWISAIEDYRITRNKVLDINMVAKHNDPTDKPIESLAEIIKHDG